MSISSALNSISAVASQVPAGIANTSVNDTNTTSPDRTRARGSSSSDPSSLIDKDDSVSVICFPSDRPRFYMSFAFMDYRRPSVFSGLSTTGVKDYICLPMPSNIKDSNSITYAEEEGSMFVDAVGPSLQDIHDQWSAGSLDLSSAAGQGLSAVGSAMVGDGVRDLVKDVTSKNVLQALGVADNPFMTIALKGPKFKTHSFAWRLSPRSRQETTVIQNIARTFKKVAYPEILSQTAGGFYRYPKIVLPKFNPDTARQYLFNFKPCVITDIDLDWAPEQVAFFDDDAPVELVMKLTLQEIELWRNGDTGLSDLLGADTLGTSPAAQAVSNIAKNYSTISGDFSTTASTPARSLGSI